MNGEKLVTFLGNRNYDIARCLLAVHCLTFMFYMGAVLNNSEMADTLATVSLNLTALSMLNFVLFGVLLSLTNFCIILSGGKK